MAVRTGKRRRSADPQAVRSVSASVRLDVNTHARVAAAAALAGMDRSAWINRAIQEALGGLIVFNRVKSSDDVDLAGEVDRAS